MIADCTAIILAGGESKRMGRDKASLPFRGQSLLQCVIERIHPLFVETQVSVRQPRADVSLPQIVDVQPEGGPLVGLISALERITTPWAFVVACDMPFVTAEVVQHLANYREGHEAVVPKIEDQVQPLAAFYAQRSLPQLHAILARGEKSLTRALNQLDVHYVSGAALNEFDHHLNSFFDLDTPQDVVIAEGMK